MALYIRRLLRAALVSALGFGGGVGLLIFIFALMLGGAHAINYALKAAIFFGLLFSVLLVVVMMLLDVTVKLYLARGFSEGVWELEQTRVVEVDGTIKQIAAASRAALLSVPNVTNVIDDTDNLLARAQTGASWRSPGEDIEVEINPVNESRWQVRCVSKPRSAKVVFDYGKNFENVETWRKQLATSLAEAINPKPRT
jgi:hypothetical protein